MVGYGLAAEKQSLEIYAKAPGQRTMIIHPPQGDNVTAIDGASGWMPDHRSPSPKFRRLCWRSEHTYCQRKVEMSGFCST